MNTGSIFKRVPENILLCPSASPPQNTKETAMSQPPTTDANERAAYVAAFNAVVASERTKRPELSRMQCVARAARSHRKLHELYLWARSPGLEKPRV